MKEEFISAAANKAAASSYATSAGLVMIAGLPLSEWSFIVAIVCAIVTASATVLLKWLEYKNRRDKW